MAIDTQLIIIIISAVISLITLCLNCFQSLRENHFNIQSPCCGNGNFNLSLDTIGSNGNSSSSNLVPSNANSIPESNIKSSNNEI